MSTDGNSRTLKEQAAHWLLGQPATTILLFCILAFIAYAAKYTVDVAIPAHLKQIQQGYVEVVTPLTSQHAIEVKAITKSMDDQREADRESRKEFRDALLQLRTPERTNSTAKAP